LSELSILPPALFVADGFPVIVVVLAEAVPVPLEAPEALPVGAAFVAEPLWKTAPAVMLTPD
jgi:hypothetical protein